MALGPLLLLAAMGSGPVLAGDPTVWIGTADYPPQALRAMVSGRTMFDLHLDADGRPVRCVVTGSSGSPLLDETACRLLMKRAKFRPAREESGNAIASAWGDEVSWHLSGGGGGYRESPPDLELETNRLPDSKKKTSFAVWRVTSPEGATLSCGIEKSSGSKAIDGQACELVKALQPRPVLSSDGTAVRGLRTVSVRIAVKK